MHLAFRMGFEKISFDITDARTAYKATVTPRLIRAAKEPTTGFGNLFPTFTRNSHTKPWPHFKGGPGDAQAIPKRKPEVIIGRDPKKRLRGKIIAVGTPMHHGFVPPKGSKNAGKYFGASTPEDKELVNRMVGLHEADELKQTHKTKQHYYSHASPDVLLRDSNRIATLGDKNIGAWNAVMANRTISGEVADLERLYPGFEFGKTRLSRHARKNATRDIEAKLKEEEEEKAIFAAMYGKR